MSIIVKTKYPKSLVAKINRYINDGKITTWAVDFEGDYTHTPNQWFNQAWMRPNILDGAVVFGIIAPEDQPISTEDYAIYHGRFAEMLLAHFDENCAEITLSPMPTKYDSIS